MTQQRNSQAQQVAAAMHRAADVLHRRPQMGVHDDATATARFEGGLRVVTRHADGTEISTDMPRELGGSGDRVSPGWLFRAGIASCLTTCIAMRAAAAGIALDTLRIEAASRSDTRGLLGLADADGEPVPPAPLAVLLRVQLSADGVPEERLRRLVEEAHRCSPIPAAVQHAVPVTLHVEVRTA